MRVTHVALDLTLDFEAHVASGEVELTLERRDRSASLVLDTNELTIASVSNASGSPLSWVYGQTVERLGQPLVIKLGADDERVRIRYRTAPQAEAVQWLAPEQTAGGKHPFLFTQGQSILTRSWIPLQDTPGVRVTYEAKVRAPEGLTEIGRAHV